jgi:outer membrane murein-binding lipoprotein Lpp
VERFGLAQELENLKAEHRILRDQYDVLLKQGTEQDKNILALRQQIQELQAQQRSLIQQRDKAMSELRSHKDSCQRINQEITNLSRIGQAIQAATSLEEMRRAERGS